MQLLLCIPNIGGGLNATIIAPLGKPCGELLLASQIRLLKCLLQRRWLERIYKCRGIGSLAAAAARRLQFDRGLPPLL